MSVTFLHGWLIQSIPGALSISNSAFGIGTETVWLSGVECSGNETHLLACPGTENIGIFTGFVSASFLFTQSYVGVRCDRKLIDAELICYVTD